jgi:hypothetical protein
MCGCSRRTALSYLFGGEKMRTLAVAFVITSVCMPASAVIWWGGGTGDWSVATNWGGSVAPGASDTAAINSNGLPFPTVSSAVPTVYNVEVGYWNAGGLTVADGGQLPVSNLLSVGYIGANWNGTPYTASTMTITGGLVGSLANTNYDPAQLWVGYCDSTEEGAHYGANGTLNMSGGRLDVRWALNVGGGLLPTAGHVNLSGGQINLWQTLNVAAGSNIDISGTGVLSLWNKYSYDSLATVQAMIADGRITGNGIVGNVQITTFANGQTDGSVGFALTAAPEPATLVLLGLGGIAFIRRK